MKSYTDILHYESKQMDSMPVHLLTVTRVGGAEDYCFLSVYISVCVSFTKMSGQIATLRLHQATVRREIIQGSKYKQDFSKTFQL